MNNTPKILIAEDEGIVAQDLSLTLTNLGYDVKGLAATGEEIIKQADEVKPDIILMDIMLSGTMTGIEAAETIMRKNNIPIIYLTALSDEETLQRAKVTDPFGFLLKPYDEKMLHSTIEMALYKHKINIQLREKTIELEQEKIITDNLLNNIFPQVIVEEYKQNGFVNPREFESVSILFTDFESFTSISSKLPPEQLVDDLNDMFKNFDTIIEKHNLEKLKTIGDSYMAAAGLPLEFSDHAVKTVNAAIELNEYMNLRNQTAQIKWYMRSGIHSGKVVAGVVGRKKMTYEIWGETVTTASKMERNSAPGKINISSCTYHLVKDFFECSFNSTYDTGEEIIDMYFIDKKK
jgi:adenylate cyclase